MNFTCTRCPGIIDHITKAWSNIFKAFFDWYCFIFITSFYWFMIKFDYAVDAVFFVFFCLFCFVSKTLFLVSLANFFTYLWIWLIDHSYQSHHVFFANDLFFVISIFSNPFAVVGVGTAFLDLGTDAGFVDLRWMQSFYVLGMVQVWMYLISILTLWDLSFIRKFLA